MTSKIIKIRIGLLLICFILSIAFIVSLYIFSLQINHRSNGFIRMLPPHLLKPLNILDMGFNSYYIAGATSNKIYLANSMAPSRFITTSYSLTDTQQKKMDFTSDPVIIQGDEMIVTDSPRVYLMEGRVPLIMEGDLEQLKINQVKPSIYYSKSVPVSANSFIVRMYDHDLKQNTLAKFNLDNSKVIGKDNSIETQGDGIFSTDGMLRYDPISKKVIYVYYYRNQISCFDTMLNILYKARTIDTTSHAQISLSTLNAQGDITMSKPPLFVNKHSCIDDSFIYVHSALMANNEIRETFNHCSVIDVYDIRGGSYKFSFYLPDLNGKKISSFRVFKKTLFAIYDHFIYAYHINF